MINLLDCPPSPRPLSTQDEMVPFEHMQQLHQAVRTSKCMWVELPRSRHMDAYLRDSHLYWKKMTEFMDRFVHEGQHAR